ncbi:amidohydrolase family protein [Paenibacillus sp. N3.4]|uniref:amidohydrolase family protein n=1 Tax=Paenibacillus sp. N3.4 TaxID=2603222 RepID=UPI0011CBBD50|nr:amidohydrolase family protein [Paenibacillus sp. N3.4]TXK78401.1 amidohydrolase [Paenibacillus sp. N3.4]
MFSGTFRVFDIHGHLPYPIHFINRNELTDQYGRERSERMRLTWDFPKPVKVEEGTVTKPLIERWIDELDRYDIAGLNFLTAQDNDDLAQQIKQFPDRFTGFAHHSIEREDAAEELRRAVDELGLRGYKLFGPLVNTPFHDPKLTPVWEFAASRKLPILIHFGVLGHSGGIVEHQNINPLSIFNVAHAFPDIPFIIPHFGAGYFKELLQLCWSCPNVHVDTSGSNQWIRWMPYDLTLETLFRKTYELLGPKRIVFGTDSSNFPRGYAHRYLQDQVRVCRDIRLPESDIELIFGNNARRLLQIQIENKREIKQ